MLPVFRPPPFEAMGSESQASRDYRVSSARFEPVRGRHGSWGTVDCGDGPRNSLLGLVLIGLCEAVVVNLDSSCRDMRNMFQCMIS